MDFLKVAAECAALHSQEVRRSLPPGYVESAEISEGMRGTFAELMTVFQEMTSFDEVLAAVKRNRIKGYGFPADGHFAQLTELDELTVDSQVERRDVLCHVDEIFDINQSPRSVLFFGNEQVAGPRPLRRAMEFIRDHRRFYVSELPGLDGPSQVVLVRRLIREGLLRRIEAATVNQPPPGPP
ncbi:MAG TPA: hypothetical protein VGS07_21395 [Thermoanaerobaculia bacterium]|jgi:hypothetical protein|nr:hypothetical protein [Thermoanaerobaculia bacterium]